MDSETGECRAGRKFAAYPYIGSEYGSGRPKLLVVGLDIGSDETPGQLQGFERRRRAIECTPLPRLNPHIAGTYFTVLKYAGSERAWLRFEGELRTCQRILKEEAPRRNHALPSANPLSRIALTNFYKWVTVGRTGKGGGTDRTHVNRDLEIELLRDEVRIFRPDVVVFQGASFKSDFRRIIKPCGVDCSYVVYHPSYRGKRRPAEIVEPLAAFPRECRYR